MNARLPLRDSPDRLSTSPILRRILLERIDRISGFRGARVLYFDGVNMVEIRPYPAICQATYLTLVIREVSNDEATALTNGSEAGLPRDSRFLSELGNAALGCGAAILSWTAVALSGAAVPLTGGTSAAVTVLSYAAGMASAAQCFNSGYRAFNESGFGDMSDNDRLDDKAWYQHTMTALDAVSLAGGVASVGNTLKMILNLKRAGASIKPALAGLNRQQRKALTEETIRALNPDISKSALKAAVRAGVYPKRYTSVQISHTVKTQLHDALGAVLGIAGSAKGGVVRNPDSLRNLAIAVMEEFEIY